MLDIPFHHQLPMSEQIFQSFCDWIAWGVLKDGEQLPTAQQLAQQWGINPRTVQKALDQLEELGIVYTVVGKGTFVCRQQDLAPLKAYAANQLKDAIQKYRRYGITEAELQSICESIFHDSSKENPSK